MSPSEADRSKSEAPHSGGTSEDGTQAPDGTSSHRSDAESRNGRSSRRRKIDAATAAVLLLAVAGWFFFIRDTGSSGPPGPTLAFAIEEPVSGAVIATDWSSPSAVAVDGDRIYVLDAGNNRILSMDHEGLVDNIICETDDCAFLLDAPTDMEYVDDVFYVANTEKGQVDVITNTGVTVRTYELPKQPGVAPRATGVHVAPDGSVYVSDWTSGKVAIFEPEGEFRAYFGADTVGDIVFEEPMGLTTDAEGNLYVTEYTPGRIVKISPIGRELATFWMIPGGTKVSIGTDVAIADNGLVFMADSKRSVVQVFSRAARHLGIVGLVDASRQDSPIALLRPQGLDTVGDEVYVIDAERGLEVYTVDPAYFVFQQAG